MSVHLNLIPPMQVEQDDKEGQAKEDSIVLQVALPNVLTDVKPTSIKQKKITCDFAGCRKKISTIEALFSKCTCEKTFCSSHRFFKDHGCTFNYHEREKERLKQQLLGNSSNNSRRHFESAGAQGNHAY